MNLLKERIEVVEIVYHQGWDFYYTQSNLLKVNGKITVMLIRFKCAQDYL